MHYLKFIYQALITNIQLSLASRFAFIMTVLSTILKQSLFLLTWKFFFGKYKMVEGWQFDDLLVMYGIVCFAMGFVESFFLWFARFAEVN